MLNLISMMITLLAIGYVIRIFIKNRKQWFEYLTKLGRLSKVKIPRPAMVSFFIAVAVISFPISLWLGRNISHSNPAWRIVGTGILWEIISILLVLLVVCIFITIKEIRVENDKMVNQILLYTAITVILQLIQIRYRWTESVYGSLLIDGIAYIFNIICIFHIIGKTFEKKVYVKNVWSTMMLNMVFIVLELSSMVYQLQQIPNRHCFNQSISSFSDSIYYVMISFFTVGYGDLYPVDITAKAISLLIVLTGFLFTTVFFGVAMSVTLEKIQQKSEKRSERIE